MSDDAAMIEIDSLMANEFEVELDGEKLPGVFRVSGLVSFKLDGTDENNVNRVQEPIILSKMVQRDGNNAFNTWLRESIKAGAGQPRPRRTVDVVAIDDGVETRRWSLKAAWIKQVRYSDFDTGLSAMVEEIVTIQFGDLEESWPASS